VGLCGVAALGIFSMIASGPMNPSPTPPAAPTLIQVEIPSDAFAGSYAGVQPSTPGAIPPDYKVLPLLTTTAPIVRAVLSSPYPSDLTITVRDSIANVRATLPSVPSSSATGPNTGYYKVINVTATNPATWTVLIRYPDSFQGSRLIDTAIADVVAGTPSTFIDFRMSLRGSVLVVNRVTENNDGRIQSNPLGIDCPGTCMAVFPLAANVSLSQGVTSNSTEFIGWTGNCAGTGPCVLAFTATPTVATVTAHFRIHSNSAIPPDMSCPAAPLITGKTWVGTPNCGGTTAPLGATLQCNASGYFCCGVSGGAPTPNCPGGNETAATCAVDNMGVFGGPELIQPGGCYTTP
jgi:proline-rich tail region repeat protein